MIWRYPYFRKVVVAVVVLVAVAVVVAVVLVVEMTIIATAVTIVILTDGNVEAKSLFSGARCRPRFFIQPLAVALSTSGYRDYCECHFE